MASKPILIGDLRGGRNGTDAPMSLPMNQVVDAVNVDWVDTVGAHKRGGSVAVSTTGGTAFGSGLQSLLRHVPGATETAAELWAVDGAPIVKRLTGGTSFANVTLDDAISSSPQFVMGVSLNGKHFLAYDSAQDRLHCYDPSLASARVRRVGIAASGTGSISNSSGGGTYAANLRYYRFRFVQMNGSIVVRRSEASASTSFTPDGAHDAALLTRPTAPGEGETHWEAEASLNNATWYKIPTYVAGTPSDRQLVAQSQGEDRTATATYATFALADAAGTYALFPSVKYLLTDGNRLLGAGAWESSGTTSGGKGSRLWYTPVLGSSDQGDDERVPNQTVQKNWVDLNENDGGAITALAGPLNGVPYAFKRNQVWKVRPTGDVTAPYLPRKVRDDIGCIAQKSIAIGDDHLGRPAIYFLSHRGPYRITVDGDVQYLGRDNEDYWRQINLSASTVIAHSVYYTSRHQWWLWIATGSSADPDVRWTFDTQLGLPDGSGQVRGGWARNDGDQAGARCSAMFANTLGASMSLDLKPYLGRSSGTTLFKGDTSDLDDAGAAYRAYVTTRPLNASIDLLTKVGLREPVVLAKAQAATSLSVQVVRDFGLETRVFTVSVAPSASETRVTPKVEGGAMGEANVVQMTIGDASAVASTWTVDAMIVPVDGQERR